MVYSLIVLSGIAVTVWHLNANCNSIYEKQSISFCMRVYSNTVTVLCVLQGVYHCGSI